MSNLYNSTVAYDSTVYEYNGDLNQPIAGLPIVGVFFAPDNGPYDDNPNWIEITNYVRAASINRGRSNDYEQFRTATASITLDNRDRLFDPFNTAGTYYGKLTPRTPIKLVAQANGSNYTLFRGYVSGFPVEWTDNGYDSTVTVDCYDLLGLLAQTELPTDWSYQVINSLSPVIWYRFDDTADATEIRNYVDSSLPLVPTAGKPLDKHPSLAPGLQTGSWEYTAVSAITVPPDYTGRHSVAWWVRNTRAFAAFGAQLVVYDKNFNMEVSFIYNSAIPANSYISFYVQDYGQGVIYTFRPPLEYYKDSAMHIVVVEADSGAPTLYINGRAVETTLLSTGTTPSPTLNIRRVQVFEGRFQEVAV